MMNLKTIGIAGAAAMMAAQVHAGGVERSTQSVAVLFEAGRYFELSFASVDPSVSGVGGGVAANPAQPTPGAASGDMAPSYWTAGMALKMPVNDKIDAALIFDQPYGADVAYPVGAPPYFAAGSTATLRSNAFTALMNYRFNDNFSVYGGLRAQDLSASALIPFIPGGGYIGSAAKDTGLGYVVGAAYEKPEIALRVALTYNSSVRTEHATTETSTLGAGRTSTTTIDTPQSLNLEFQTGIAQDTLLFGSVRWVNWSDFDISPDDYATITGGSLVSYDDDTITYNIGVGRRLNETWSIAGTITHEPQVGGFTTNLGPTDGKTSVGLGATYTQDGMKITAGVSYTWIGDANTQLSGSGLPAGVFTDNTAVAFGMKVGFSF